MIKMSRFNKINYVLTVDAFIRVCHRRTSEVLMADVLKIGTVHKYMLHCQWNVIMLVSL